MTEASDVELADQEPYQTSSCTVCTHSEAARIDEQLLSGTSIRTVSETFKLSRSSVHRHRTNHLSVQAIVEPTPAADREPLQMVDVHRQLTGLCDRLEKVVEIATRTRKAAAAVQAMREQRQALEAIARLQADPKLLRAASLDQLDAEIRRGSVHFTMECLKFVLGVAGLSDVYSGRQVWWRLMAACLRTAQVSDRLDTPSFSDIDTSAARAHLEQLALAQAQRVEAEVERRVAAELGRLAAEREAAQRRVLEQRRPLAIENVGPSWSS